MKKVSFLILAVFVALAIFVAAGFVWYKSSLSAPSDSEEAKRVVIVKGASAKSISNSLKESGVIKSASAFELYLKLNNLSTSVPSGQFDIPQNLSASDVLSVLKKGPTQIWVTVPEGLRREEVVGKVVEALALSGDEAKDFEEEFIEASSQMEGYLFPDTYLFPPDVAASFVVKTMRNTFDLKFPESQRAKLQNLNLSLDEAVTLASLIERETLTKEERPVVAGILLNRLEIDMPLQIDATVQYAVASQCQLSSAVRDCVWWPKNLTRDQIQNTNSPYNTYQNAGIPPAPISSPGLESLLAVANPQSTDYFYYIHADGQIYYAKDLTGHNANIARYLR